MGKKKLGDYTIREILAICDEAKGCDICPVDFCCLTTVDSWRNNLETEIDTSVIGDKAKTIKVTQDEVKVDPVSGNISVRILFTDNANTSYCLGGNLKVVSEVEDTAFDYIIKSIDKGDITSFTDVINQLTAIRFKPNMNDAYDAIDVSIAYDPDNDEREDILILSDVGITAGRNLVVSDKSVKHNLYELLREHYASLLEV